MHLSSSDFVGYAQISLQKDLLGHRKTKLIIYGSRQMIAKLPEFRLSLLGKELEPSEFVKDLGVILDKNLTFNEHIIKTVSSCVSALGQISRVKHAFRKDTLREVVKTILHARDPLFLGGGGG